MVYLNVFPSTKYSAFSAAVTFGLSPEGKTNVSITSESY